MDARAFRYGQKLECWLVGLQSRVKGEQLGGRAEARSRTPAYGLLSGSREAAGRNSRTALTFLVQPLNPRLAR